MSQIIEKHIESVHEMQMDLLSDGEIPVPFSDWAWHAECLVNGSEETEDLANLIAKGAAEQIKEYAESNKLCMGMFAKKGDYTQVRIYSHIGKLGAEVCYATDSVESQLLILGTISRRYPKVIWI